MRRMRFEETRLRQSR